jgi:hypothetical protein
VISSVASGGITGPLIVGFGLTGDGFRDAPGDTATLGADGAGVVDPSTEVGVAGVAASGDAVPAQPASTTTPNAAPLRSSAVVSLVGLRPLPVNEKVITSRTVRRPDPLRKMPAVT